MDGSTLESTRFRSVKSSDAGRKDKAVVGVCVCEWVFAECLTDLLAFLQRSFSVASTNLSAAESEEAPHV